VTELHKKQQQQTNETVMIIVSTWLYTTIPRLYKEVNTESTKHT